MSVTQDWKSRKLTDLAEYINGYAFKPEDWDKHGLPIIRIEQLKNPDSISDYFSGRLPEHNIIDNNDLIFSWSASLFLSIWKGGKAALNQHLFKVIEKEGIDRHFLKHFIEFYLPEIVKVSHGSTMQHITRKELDRFRAVFPCNKSEQIKIAEILSTVDQAIEQTEALIAKQQRVRTGLMQDLLTHGIDEDGNLRSEETHEFKDSPLGRIPVEWEVKELCDFCDVTSSKRVFFHDYETEGIPFYRSKEIIELAREGKTPGGLYIKESKYLEIERIFGAPKEGDVLISSVGTLGVCYLVKNNDQFYFKDGNLIWLRRFVEQVNRTFLIALLPRMIKAQFDDLVIGTSQKAFTIEKLKRLKLFIPSTEEQNRLAISIQQFQSKLDCEIHSLQKFRSLKTGLMQDLLTGKVSVTSLLTEPEISI